MKRLTQLVLAGCLALSVSGYAKTIPQPEPFIEQFYKTYLSGNSVLTPELLSQLSPFAAKNFKQWQKCKAGDKNACSVDCIDLVCYYDGILIPEKLDYFTLTEKPDPRWADYIKQKILVDDKDGCYTVKVTAGDSPDLDVDVRYIKDKWELMEVREHIPVNP